MASANTGEPIPGSNRASSSPESPGSPPAKKEPGEGEDVLDTLAFGEDPGVVEGFTDLPDEEEPRSVSEDSKKNSAARREP